MYKRKKELSKIWDFWSGAEGEKEKKEETSVASPRKRRNKQMQCLICDGRGRRGENFETQFCQAEALQISYSPTSKTFTPSQGCHQGLPSIALWYLMGITGTESGPNTKQGLLSFSLEGTGDPKEVWEMPKRVAFLWQLHFLTVQFCATQQLCSKAQFVS